MYLEPLEDRSTPVSFSFTYLDPIPYEAAVTLEAASRCLGNPLSPGVTIPVTVSTAPLVGALAVGGPTSSGNLGTGGAITFDLTERWHFGLTEIGLDGSEYDFFTVAVHELGHVLGVGTQPGWSDGPRSRGIPLSGDGFHFGSGVVAVMSESVGTTGRRLRPTRTDWEALGDLGWNPRVPLPPYELFTLTGHDGRVRQYATNGTVTVPTGVVSPFHFAVADYDFDGDLDIRVSTPGPGFDVVFTSDFTVLGTSPSVGTSLLRTP